MFITLYFIVTRLPDSLRSVRDHFLSLDPTSLTVDLLEQHLLAAETSAVAVVRSAASASARVVGVVEEAAVVVEVAVGAVVGAAVEEVEAVEVVAAVGLVAALEALVAAVEAAEGVAAVEALGAVVVGKDLGVEALVVVGASSSSIGARPRCPSSSVSGWFNVGRVRVVRPERIAEGDCYQSVPPDLGIAAAALGASASGTSSGTAPAAALHTFTLDSCASRCFFRDTTTLTPLPAPVPVRLADPSGGPVVARSSTVPPCPAVPSGSLSGRHLPSFSTNLVSTAALQDVMVTTTTPGGQRVSICMCTRTGRHLATFTRRPRSSLYTLATEPPQVAASAQPSLPCLPCVEGRQCTAPHSSSFPPTNAPLQTLHMDVWGPARVSGQGRERYFLLVVDDYTRYTTVFPLRTKGEVSAVLIPGSARSVSSWASVMEVARTSMIHAAAPHFMWPFAVRYATHQLNLWPRVSLPETLPTLRWTGKVGDVSVFRVWGSRAFVHDTSAGKLSARTIPCIFLGFFPNAPGWQFYHPTSHHVLLSQDVTFDESVPFYCLFPYRSAPPPPPPLFLAPGPPPLDPLPPQGPAPSGVSQVDPLPGTAPVQVAVVSGASPGAASGGAAFGGAASGGAEPGGAGSEGARSGEGLESLGAEPRGAALSGRPAGASPRLSSQRLREWLVQRAHRRSGPPGAGKPWDTRAGGAAVTTRARDPTEPGAARAGGAGAGVAGVGGPGAGGAGAAGAGAVDPGAGGAGGTVRPRPYFVPLLRQVLGVPSSTGLPPPFLCPPPDHSQPPLQPSSPLLVPSPSTAQSVGLTVRREPAPRPFLPVRTAPRAPCSRPPPVPSTHTMALPRAASPTVARLLATAVTDPSFESAAAFALVAELLDFAAACRLHYASALVAESVSASPPSVGGECALGTNVLEDRQEDFECLAAAVPGFASLLLAPEGDPDALDIPTPRTYVEAITGTQWSLRRPVYGLRQAPHEWHDTLRTTLAALGFVPSRADPSLFLRTDTLLLLFYVLVYVDDLVFATADTEALTLVKSELQKRHTCTDLCELRSYLGLQITQDRARRTITLTQSHMVHHVLQRFGFQYSSPQPTPLSTSHSLSAPPSDESVEPSGPYPEIVGCLMYLMTCSRPDLAYPLSLLARYVAPCMHRKVHWDAAKRVLRYLCSTLSMGLVLGGRGPVVLTSQADASWVDDSATEPSSQGYTFSLGSGSVSSWSTRSSSVFSSSCEAEIYKGVMAAQELRWLTYLLTDQGEQPCSPPVLYVDYKAMIALCREHITKHIALRYFLARELQQRGQLRLAYVATRANTADVFTKALPPGDHQRFVTMLGLVPTLPHLLTP
ncbi:unnamed protein product [Closterium sp. NIES-54]